MRIDRHTEHRPGRLRQPAWDWAYSRRPVRACAGLVLVVLVCGGLIGWPVTGPGPLVAHADDPQGAGNRGQRKGVDRSLAWITNRRVSLTAGPDGPTFGLSDLQNYTPPPPVPLPHSPIQLARWLQYPTVLDSVPPSARQYEAETITYLAQHEIRSGDRNGSYVALTFDCEGEPASTRLILSALHEASVRATFFVEGKYVYLWPEITREIVAGGHELGSHSFYHPEFSILSPVTATLELTYTEAAVTWAVGHPVPMRYLRFPYGRRDNTTRQFAASMGYQSVFWDMDPRGWEPQTSTEDVIAYVRQTAHPGGIIIMHCGCWDDARALPGIIQAIREKNLIPGTVTDVLTAQDRDVPGY